MRENASLYPKPRLRVSANYVSEETRTDETSEIENRREQRQNTAHALALRSELKNPNFPLRDETFESPLGRRCLFRPQVAVAVESAPTPTPIPMLMSKLGLDRALAFKLARGMCACP